MTRSLVTRKSAGWLLTLAAALAALLSLVACAPGAAGTVGNPFRIGDDNPSARRGETIVVRVDYTVDQFGIDGRDLRSAMWVAAGTNAEIGDVSGSFHLSDVRVAPGWDLRLLQVRAERRSVSSGVRYRLWALFEVTTSADSIPGDYRVRATLSASDGGSVPVTFAVTVGP